MINIYDIAQQAGVSCSTVSRVLNNRPSVNQKTREKVLQVIEQLSYTPNVTAQSLARRKTNIIGIISRDFFSPFNSKMANGLINVLAKTCYTAILHSTIPGNSSYKSLFGNVDGIVVLDHDAMSDEEIREFIARGIPVGVIDDQRKIDNVIEVSANNFRSAYLAVEYLIRQGHRRIGYIFGMGYYAFKERFAGYRQALTDHDIPINQRWLINGEGKYTRSYEKAYKLLNQNLTAVFACNDASALGFMRLANELGVRIPDEISVIGFDDISNDFYYFNDNMKITTLRQPVEGLSAHMIESLICVLDQGTPLSSQIFEAELVRATATVRKYSENSCPVPPHP